MTAVVIFFSRAGENYIYGKKQQILVGNTAVLAEKISRSLGIESFPLVPQNPYSEKYEETLQRSQAEKQRSQRVDYQELSFDFQKVETFFLGFPNWWGTYPRIIATFLADHAWEHQVIYPFCTHEGSSFGSSIQDLKSACPKATIKTGLALRGSKVAGGDTAVRNWLLTD